MVKVLGGNPITITETVEIPISIYSPYVLLETLEQEQRLQDMHKKKTNPFNQNQQEYNFEPGKGVFCTSLSLTFLHFLRNQTEDKEQQITGKVRRKRK
jgi:hypothetical protein